MAAAADRGSRAGWQALLAVHRQLRRHPMTPASVPTQTLPALQERFRHAFLHALLHARAHAAPAVNHTLLGCLWDRHRLLVAQVGDTAVLLRRGGRWSLPLPPAKGEFANETCFLRADTPGETIGLWWAPVQSIEAVIGFSDGLEAAFLSPSPGSPQVLLPNAPLLDLVLEQHQRRCGWRGYGGWLAASLADPALGQLSDDDRSLVIAA